MKTSTISYLRDRNRLRGHHKHKKEPESTLLSDRPRIIHNGVDRTPMPLLEIPKDHQKNSKDKLKYKYKSCSIEDIGYLKQGTTNGLSFPSSCSEYTSIPWLDGSAEDDLVYHDWKPLDQQKQLFEYARLLTNGITVPKPEMSLQDEMVRKKVTMVHEHKKKGLTYIKEKIDTDRKEEITDYCEIVLTETSTNMILNRQSRCSLITSESAELENTDSKQGSSNDHETNMIHNSRFDSQERATQTINTVPHTKTTMTACTNVVDVGCTVSPANLRNMDKIDYENKDKIISRSEFISIAATKCEG